MDRLLGSSPQITRVREIIARIASVAAPVLVRGESGTGKDLAAQQLHRRSGRRGRFVAVNCGAVGAALAESMLFGHVRGAFTGALRDRVGAFARADAGTLFLDEVAELPLPLQAMLLRALETSRVLPLGSEDEVTFDVRLIAATHRDLETAVVRGDFREDLYHRLRVLELVMPPLRERPDDIPILLEHFASRVAEELGHPVRLHKAALAAAQNHAWPGNIRALKNAVLRAGATSRGLIDAATLLDGERMHRWVSHLDPLGGHHLLNPIAAADAPAVAVPRGDYRTMNLALLRQAVAEHGSIRRAAKALGVPRSTLSAWLRR